jgi:serine/threonine-protein kinase
MTAPADDLFLRLQTALAGEYSIERELGRGGMGIVYLAREVRLAREVAIKVLPPALAGDPTRRAQFLREAQTAAGLSHPNIVPIHRVDETQGFVYFVMAYIAGETLAERIASRGPLAPHHAGRVLREVAWALTYAHANGIVHRDVKADNIMLERAAERALVTDFGIANVADTDARTSDGDIAGSPHYASPEQIAGEPVDAASDLYSLGVVGFFALTGRLPFDAPTAREVCAMHLSARPPSITSLAPTVPAKLAQLVDRCLAKRPDARPASAAAFAEALEQSAEPPREIPAPIRVWLTRTNQFGALPALFTVYCGVSLVGGVVAGAISPALAMIAGTTVSGLLALPTVLRARQLMKAGYGIDDLRVAIREHWLRRREEEVYELSPESAAISTKAATITCGVTGVAAVLIQMMSPVTGISALAPFYWVSAVTALATGGLALGRVIRRAVSGKQGKRQMKLYNGKFGERLFRLAGLGLQHRAQLPALSQLTEVALGRATDALYDALPKDVKKQLKQLPPTVRRLEEDAKGLRTEIERLDASLIALDADIAHAQLRDDRARLRADVEQTRQRADDRLAATVAALESIRLDLLRLQMGDGRVESVTATLDAARDVGADLRAYVEASEEVERALRPRLPLAPRTSSP